MWKKKSPWTLRGWCTCPSLIEAMRSSNPLGVSMFSSENTSTSFGAMGKTWGSGRIVPDLVTFSRITEHDNWISFVLSFGGKPKNVIPHSLVFWHLLIFILVSVACAFRLSDVITEPSFKFHSTTCRHPDSSGARPWLSGPAVQGHYHEALH